MSITSSVSLRHRSPSGSLAHCCWMMPAEQSRSRCRAARGRVMPMSASRSRASSRTSTAGAYASGDGSNPGSVRRNSSWQRGRSSSAKSTKPCAPNRKRSFGVLRCRAPPPSDGAAPRCLPGTSRRRSRAWSRSRSRATARASRRDRRGRAGTTRSGPARGPGPTPLRGSRRGWRRGARPGGHAVPGHRACRRSLYLTSSGVSHGVRRRQEEYRGRAENGLTTAEGRAVLVSEIMSRPVVTASESETVGRSGVADAGAERRLGRGGRRRARRRHPHRTRPRAAGVGRRRSRRRRGRAPG